MNKSPIHCGIVGIHGFARDHFTHLLQLQDEGLYTVQAAVAHQRELDPAYADDLVARGVKLVPDLDALLAEAGLDLITLPVSIHLHLPFARRVLESGRACFLEKPVAATLTEGMALQRIQNATDQPLFIGFQDLFHPAIYELKQRLLGGIAGRIKRIVVTAASPRNNDYYNRNRWAGRLWVDGMPVRDSPVNNACAHYLALALFLAGGTETESAWPLSVRGGLWRTRRLESFDSASLSFTTDTGVEVLFTVSHAAPEAWGHLFRMEGDAGTIESDYRGNHPVWHLPRGVTLPMAQGRSSARFRHVADVMRGGQAPVCSLAQALPHSAAVDLIHATLPIRDIPADMIREEEGKFFHRDMDKLLREAHRQGTTLDNLGFCRSL